MPLFITTCLGGKIVTFRLRQQRQIAHRAHARDWIGYAPTIPKTPAAASARKRRQRFGANWRRLAKPPCERTYTVVDWAPAEKIVGKLFREWLREQEESRQAREQEALGLARKTYGATVWSLAAAAIGVAVAIIGVVATVRHP